MTAPFDLEQPWALDSRVALRPEPFGALAYHFGTRRLSFLKTKKLVAVVERLLEEPSARDACRCGRLGGRAARVRAALASLAAKGMIVERESG